MLVRAYRLTDKLSIVALKTLVGVVELTLDGLSILTGILGAILSLLLKPIIFIFNALLGKRLNRGGAEGIRGTTANMMARRAARAEMTAVVVEDPLKRQNRTLSALTVILLLALVGVVLWATSPSRLNNGAITGSPLGVDSSASNLFASTDVGQGMPTQVSVLSTPVPTVTPLPSVLSVQGSLAYVVRENGQQDIWVVPVGSRSPIRITNSLEDDRDPAWSPDGTRLAYASRQDDNWEIYVYEVATGESTRMTYDLSFQAGANWSPDGEWLVYESYQGNNLDIYIMRIDGSQAPIRLPGNSDAPDFSPAWSPDGRRIAFTSWRDGNQDIYVFSLDDQSVVNVTNTPDRNEDYAAWHPDSNTNLLAYSAYDQGVEKIFVKSASDIGSPAQVLDRGRIPSWSPDGSSVIFTVDTIDGTQLIASPYSNAGLITTILPVPLGSNSPVWTESPLPPALVNRGSLPPARTEPLFIEQVDERPGDPPFALNSLVSVNVENPALSSTVNDSFNALREATLLTAGWDFLGRLDDAFWPLDRPPEPGIPRRSWLLTGRAFSITRNSIVGFPPFIEVVREDIGVETLWRVYVRAADDAQSGQLGEPLRMMPWDFASRTQGDIQAYDQGGRIRSQMPEGYYIDFTQLALDYLWNRAPAGNDWRANSNTMNYWLFEQRNGLDWYDAMREIYPEGQLINFAPTAIPSANSSNVTPTAIIQQLAPTPIPEETEIQNPEVVEEPIAEGQQGE